ncbi:MAG: adenylate/guanylate cyclase domain-containing protein [Burkholderiales bacterium]
MAREQRRLTAIVAADVAGYSRLMGADESGTLATLKAHLRELIDPKIAEYGGRTVKSMGDGLLLEFPSVVDAVRCAVDVQRGMQERNEGVPADRQILFRIGINVGDIIIDGDDIHGDGVNVAARLEGIAEPGGICVSRGVRDQVLDKLDFAFDELGAKQVKNIARPVDVYRIDIHGAATDRAIPQSRRRHARPWIGAAVVAVAVAAGLAIWWSAHRPAGPDVRASAVAASPLSIVVLPFANLTGDPGQDYFAEGLTATLTSDLSQIDDAIVVDSATAQSYKGKPLTAQQIGSALGVRYVLQGNVQRSGKRVRVAAQLADAVSNAQLWSDTFEGDDADLFTLQDRLTAKIANTMGREIVFDAAQKSASQAGNPTVTDLILRARALGNGKPSLGALEQAEALYRKALEIQPGHPKATMELASSLAFEVNNYGGSFKEEVRGQKWRELMELAEKAHVADPGNPEYYRIVAFHARSHGDPAGERRAAEELVRLRPKWAYPYNVLGSSYMRDGDFDKAVELISRAVDLTPKIDAGGQVFALNLCAAQFGAGNNKAAIEACGKVTAAMPTASRARYFLAMAYALDGDVAKARSEAEAYRKLVPDQKLDPDAMRAEARTPARKAYVETKVIPALRTAGLLE